MRISRRDLFRQSVLTASFLIAAGAAPPTAPAAERTPTPVPTATRRTPTPVPARPAPTATPGIAAPAVQAGQVRLETLELGRSVRGRPIVATRLGTGPIAVAFIGNIHGGWEPLAQQVVELGLSHFYWQQPFPVPPAVSLYFVPTMNPDGFEDGKYFWADADGSGGPTDQALARTAFNANGVDLNRNFPTNWSAHACSGEKARLHLNPNCLDWVCGSGCFPGLAGPAPFSEPETRAYRDFIVNRQIRMALTYHESGLPSVSIREGGGGQSEPLARELAEVLGYEYLAVWPHYQVTGQAQDWLDANGVRGAEIELQYRLVAPLDMARNVLAMKIAIDRALTG